MYQQQAQLEKERYQARLEEIKNQKGGNEDGDDEEEQDQMRRKFLQLPLNRVR